MSENAPPEGSSDSTIDEYKDLSENMRDYGNKRFALMTLFVALTAGLLSAIFTQDPPLSSQVKSALKVVGFVTSIVFWIMEERAADYWHHFRRRAVELEEVLGYKQYQERPKPYIMKCTISWMEKKRLTRWIYHLATSLVTATNAVRAFYGFWIIAWVATLIWHSCF